MVTLYNLLYIVYCNDKWQLSRVSIVNTAIVLCLNMYKQHVLSGMRRHIRQRIKGPCLLQFYDMLWYKLLILSYKYWRKKTAMNSWSRLFSVFMCRVIKQKVFSIMNRFFFFTLFTCYLLFNFSVEVSFCMPLGCL